MSKSNRSHSNPRDCGNSKQVKFDLSTNKHHASFTAAKHGDMPLKLSGRSSSARQMRPMSGNKQGRANHSFNGGRPAVRGSKGDRKRRMVPTGKADLGLVLAASKR